MDKLLAAVGGVIGGVVAFVLWLLAVNRQLKRASRAMRGSGTGMGQPVVSHRTPFRPSQ